MSWKTRRILGWTQIVIGVIWMFWEVAKILGVLGLFYLGSIVIIAAVLGYSLYWCFK